jgi:hypothetical protein
MGMGYLVKPFMAKSLLKITVKINFFFQFEEKWLLHLQNATKISGPYGTDGKGKGSPMLDA